MPHGAEARTRSGARADKEKAGCAQPGAVMTGQMITHYRIGEKVGEGGSASVYRADDLSLGREVVIKIFAGGEPGIFARFQHEARTISCLNHPNICTIYETGEHEGHPFLVMERLDGDVLSRAIGGRPLPLAQIIDLGTQIADALDAAHAEGIVHRDVKPENILLTHTGRIKLLDFGVAVILPRRVDPTTARSLLSSAGTIPYMSPEQARVEAVDHRSDLFSLGIILYEMTTGRRPFGGSTAADVLSEIVGQAPAEFVRDVASPRNWIASSPKRSKNSRPSAIRRRRI